MKRLVREKIVENTNGQIKQRVQEFITDGENKYVKTYPEGTQAFRNNHSLFYVFTTLVGYAEYADADSGECVVRITPDLKERIALDCDIKLNSLSKDIMAMQRMGALARKCRGSYIVNPFFAGKGREKDIEKARSKIKREKEAECEVATEEFLKKASELNVEG